MSPQQTIAHYTITAKLGEGGMGEVWRATDTKLGREVAIKVLPESFAADPDRMARFQREAQVLASLNHPNIAAIYGVEERALVMELVDGPTLAERIAQGPLPLEEALPIARHIAEALEYAHERGVVHRDLKPANIKLAPDGRVKLLDFGLAKALTAGAPAGSPASSPTLTLHATMAGVIVGTAAYMAPEQARGQDVDRRADIWAFGVVLYEMLTGRRLFAAPTISDTLAAVLRSEPDWSALPADVPSNVRAMLRRCLERDARRRLRDIGDGRLELEQPAPPEHVAAPPARRPRWTAWIAAAVLGLAAAALAVLHFREAPAPAPQVHFGVPPPQKGAFSVWLALSPDGRNLAFNGAATDGAVRIWVRPLDGLEARPLRGTEGTVTFFWSPDSRFLVFQSVGKIKKMDIAGGPPQTICDAPAVMLGGSWNARGEIIFGSNSGPIRRVLADGGTAAPVTALNPERGDSNDTDPVFLPDGRHFLFLRRSERADSSGIYAASLDDKPEAHKVRRIQASEFSFSYAPPRGNAHGHLLFLRDDSLVAQPFEEQKLEVAGEAVPIAENVGTSITRAFFSTSPNGILVYRPGTDATMQLNWYDRDGRILGRAGDASQFQDVAISPDQSRVAYSRPSEGGNRQIWVLELARGINTRISFVPQGARSPVWSPDGRYLAFSSVRGNAMYVKDVKTAAEAQIIHRAGVMNFVNDWSRDGRFLIYTQPSRILDIWALPNPLGGGERKPLPVADTEFSESQAQVSPDSRWVAYVSNESGRFEVYVRPFPPGDGRSGKTLVSSNGGSEPRWRGDGKELFYVSADNRLMAVDVRAGDTFESAAPHALFTAPAVLGNSNVLFQYDVARDGRRFLCVAAAAAGESPAATVVLNWDAGLKL